MKRHCIGILLAVMLVTGCSSADKSATADTVPVASTEATTISDADTEETIETFTENLNESFKKDNTDDYTATAEYKADVKTIVVYVTIGGSAEAALEAKNHPDDKNNTWSKARDYFTETCAEWTDDVHKNFGNDYFVTIIILNDHNKDNALMVITDGFVISDVAEDGVANK